MAGLEGKILSDRYELRRVVGRGGMADVYEGYDPRFQRTVAIKVFKREDEEMLRRFIREAHLMARLSNEHLVAVYDSGSSPVDGVTWYYIVMPFMEGGTLRARIRRSPLTLPEACRSMLDIASALDYIHSQGIVHRDIKSSNVLLDAEGRCYLADFGIARTTSDATQLTSTGNVLGTVDYIAPELFEINRRADAYSDLYSLGVLLFEMVTGQLPFSADNQIALVAMHVNKRPPSPRSISQQISPQVERVILRGLEKKPEQRYATATEFANAFCRAVTQHDGQYDNGAKRGTAEFIEPVMHGKSAEMAPLPMAPLPLYPEQPKIRLSSPAGSMQAASFMPPPPQPRPPVLPPEPPRKSLSVTQRRVLISVSLMAVALLLLSGFLFLVVPKLRTANNAGETTTTSTQTTSGTQASATATPNVTATALAQAQATAAARAQATATAHAQATATVLAQATATAGVIATATSGSPTYKDTLNDATNSATQAAGWDGLNGFDSHCIFKTDGYHVIQPTTQNEHACQEKKTYTNVTITVDMAILKGQSGGLLVRSSDFLGYHGYLFEVDSTGRYRISVLAESNVVLQNWTTSAALKTGYTVTNTLQVLVRDSTFSFYANGVFLTTATDGNYSSGEIALMAIATNDPTEVVYSNLRVYP